MNYKYKGAEALVSLHEERILLFVEVWKTAKQANLELPLTNDSDYKTLNHLLRHVVRSSRGYMVWICEKLNLPEPQINILPNLEEIETTIEGFATHLLYRWKLPLSEVEEKRFFTQTYISNWGTDYCIEAMLEHAVMHPVRHEFQLQNLLLTT